MSVAYSKILLSSALLFFVSVAVNPCFGKEQTARVQPTVPEGWTEKPFIEVAPEPILSREDWRRGYQLFHRPITEPVHANTHPRAHETLRSLNAFATPGEFEPVTLSIYPVRELKKMTVRCSDLTSGKNKIAASQIDVRLQTYWNIGYPRYASRETYRLVPELLEQVTSHTSPAKQCQRYWITVHVPKDAKPGLYEGKITVQDARNKKPVIVPLSFRVLGFSLKQDPRKHLSAYYYPRSRYAFKGKEEAFIDRATANEFQSMIDHGLNMLPTFYLQYDTKLKKFYVQSEGEIDRALAAGLKGPLLILGGNGITRIYREMTPGGKRGSHWNINKMPPPEFYATLEKKFRQFKKECTDRGWPEIVCCPLDEVSAAMSDFGSKVYKALHEAGVRTYATKYPQATDAIPYKPYVDAWCSQPFGMPYEKVVADKNHEYWAYPNHNAGERKNRKVMCKGGRMTYGFGFWRSGYTTLVPWHWSWTMEPDPFDYLRTKKSGCGQRIDENGEIIPTIYWECFREGNDDGRYLYTLQQAAWERVGSSDPKCEAIVKQAREMLQETWDSIEVQERYLADHMWRSEEFNARRWQMAKLTQQLLKFPAHRKGVAPSVFLERTTQLQGEKKTLIEKAMKQGNLESLDLGEDFSQWIASTDESSKENSAVKTTMKWNVKVDHNGGGQPDGKYNVGWPRVSRTYKKGLDMGAYDFLEIQLQVDSDRDEVQDDVTRFGLSLSSLETRRLYETRKDLGDVQREKINLQYSIPEMVSVSDKGTSAWKTMSRVQFFIAEGDYPHGVKMKFDVESVRLLRFKTPMISLFDAPNFLLLRQQKLSIPFALMGTRSIKEGTHRVTATLRDSKKKRQAQVVVDPAEQNNVVLDISKLPPGEYRLDLDISTSQWERCHKLSKTITLIAEPTSPDSAR